MKGIHECINLHERAQVIGKLTILIESLDTETAKDIIQYIEEIQQIPQIAGAYNALH